MRAAWVVLWFALPALAAEPERLHTLQVLTPSGWSTEYLISMDFSPDGGQLAVGTSQGVQIWDVATGKRTIELPRQVTNGRVRFSADGSLNIASGSGLSVWRLGTSEGTELSEWRAPCARDGGSDPLFSMAISPTDGVVALGCESGLVRLWDAQKKKPVQDLVGHTRLVRSIVFSDDGATLITSGDDMIRVWTRSGKQLRSFSPAPLDRALHLTARPGKHEVFAAGFSNEVVLLNWDTGKTVRSFAHDKLHGLKGSVDSVSASADGSRLVSAGQGRLLFWDVESGARQREVRGALGDEAFLLGRSELIGAWRERKSVKLYRIPPAGGGPKVTPP